MKKRINLFTQNISNKRVVYWVQKIGRLYGTILGIVIVAILLSSGAYLYFSNKVTSETKTRDNLNQFLATNVDFDKKIKIFIYKYALLKQYLTEDAGSYQYYTFLTKLLESSGIDIKINKFEIDNAQLASFTLEVKTYEDALTFLKIIEGPEYLLYFEYLKLKEFTIIDASTEVIPEIVEPTIEPIEEVDSSEEISKVQEQIEILEKTVKEPEIETIGIEFSIVGKFKKINEST